MVGLGGDACEADGERPEEEVNLSDSGGEDFEDEMRTSCRQSPWKLRMESQYGEDEAENRSEKW